MLTELSRIRRCYHGLTDVRHAGIQHSEHMNLTHKVYLHVLCVTSQPGHANCSQTQLRLQVFSCELPMGGRGWPSHTIGLPAVWRYMMARNDVQVAICCNNCSCSRSVNTLMHCKIFALHSNLDAIKSQSAHKNNGER